MSVSFWNDFSLHNKKTNDVVIIGGGIAGLSSAYWLKQRDKNLKIAIVEKNEIGSGATGRNAGFITCGSVEHFNRMVLKHGEDRALEIWKFSEENLKLLKEHIIDNFIDDDSEIYFEQHGSFSLASTENEYHELKQSYELMRRMGIHVENLTEVDIEKRLGAKEFVGGIKYINDGSVHPILLLRKLYSILINMGVEFYENHEVYNITSCNNSRIVKTNKHQFETSLVIMATNAYSPLLNSYFSDKIFPTRGQILITSPVTKFMEGPCYANFVLDYFRQLPTGELVIGGFRQLQKQKEVGYSDEITDEIQTALEQFLNKHIPNVRSAAITHRWSGIMGFSVDGEPLVGSLPTDNQVFFIAGFTGHGLGLAFHAAKALASSIMGDELPDFISAKRF